MGHRTGLSWGPRPQGAHSILHRTICITLCTHLCPLINGAIVSTLPSPEPTPGCSYTLTMVAAVRALCITVLHSPRKQKFRRHATKSRYHRNNASLGNAAAATSNGTSSTSRRGMFKYRRRCFNATSCRWVYQPTAATCAYGHRPQVNTSCYGTRFVYRGCGYKVGCTLITLYMLVGRFFFCVAMDICVL